MFNRKDDRAGRCRSRSRLRPRLTPLEGRELLSVATFDPGNGTLTVDMTRNRVNNVLVIDQVNGVVGIDGRRDVVQGVAGGALSSSAVRRIVVNGSDFGDVISLEKVDDRGFSGLGGKVAITGNGGADTIYGSQFADRIDGNAGEDRIFGLGGNDTIGGGRGHDYIQGDNGHDDLDGGDGDDAIVGGSGNDTMTGGLGDDVLSGQAGRDRYIGGPGDRDNAWEWSPEDFVLPPDVELLGGRKR